MSTLRDDFLARLKRCFAQGRNPREPWSVWNMRQLSPQHIPPSAIELLQEYEEKLMAELKKEMHPLTRDDLGDREKPKPAAKKKLKSTTTHVSRERWALIKRVLDTRHRCNAVLDTPSSTPLVKWRAIAAWAQALLDAGMAEDVLGKEFLALIVIAGRKLAKEKV